MFDRSDRPCERPNVLECLRCDVDENFENSKKKCDTFRKSNAQFVFAKALTAVKGAKKKWWKSSGAKLASANKPSG